MKTVKDIDVKGKYVMVRAGLDVPLDAKKDLLDPNRVTDDTRIKDILPTLKYLVENNAKVILAAGWCGRPKGEDPDYSMAPVAKKIEQLIGGKQVLIAPNCFEDKKPRSVNNNREEVKEIVAGLEEEQIVVLENVRYDPEANAGDEEFGNFIGSLVGNNGVYVNDAETQNHRPEATIVVTPLAIAKNNGEVVYGFKYADVLENIGGLRDKLEDSNRGSFVFGLCGKKIESDPGITSKITVAKDLIDIMKEGDSILTGGAVVYTFILAEHYADKIEENMDKVNEIVDKYNQMIIDKTSGVKDKKEAKKITADVQKQKSDELKALLGITDVDIKKLVGDSYIRWGQEGEQIVFAYSVIAKAKAKGVEVVSALDHTIANGFPNKAGLLEGAEVKLFDEKTGILLGWLGVGEGSKSLEKISEVIGKAAIYIQSGPYSIEDPKVEEVSSTNKIIFSAVKKCKDSCGITIGAGGDTIARVNSYNAQDAFSTVTSAGGGTLELINGKSKGRDAVEEAQKLKQ